MKALAVVTTEGIARVHPAKLAIKGVPRLPGPWGHPSVHAVRAPGHRSQCRRRVGRVQGTAGATAETSSLQREVPVVLAPGHLTIPPPADPAADGR